jgi:hypothetical protein
LEALVNKHIGRLASLTVFAALVLAPVAAAAQGRGREGGGQRGGGRGEGQGRSAQGPGARQESRAVPRERSQAPRPGVQNSQRYDAPSQQRFDGPSQQRYAAPQRYASPPRYSPPVRYNAPRYSAPRYNNSYNYGYSSPYRYYSNRPVYRPYYSFVPRLRLGFGIYLGNAVSFPSWYDPYVPGVYSSYRPGGAYGGLSFDIQPYDASVYIDGNYAGVADEFSPVRAPLTLPAGRHRIDIDAPGYAPLSFEITVVPRQVIPYHGSLGR